MHTPSSLGINQVNIEVILNYHSTNHKKIGIIHYREGKVRCYLLLLD